MTKEQTKKTKVRMRLFEHQIHGTAIPTKPSKCLGKIIKMSQRGLGVKAKKDILILP